MRTTGPARPETVHLLPAQRLGREILVPLAAGMRLLRKPDTVKFGAREIGQEAIRQLTPEACDREIDLLLARR